MEDIFVVVIMFVILIALLKKPAELRINELYDKITELEKRFDEIKIIQHHEKQELTDKTNEMFKKFAKIEKQIDDNNITELDKNQVLLNKFGVDWALMMIQFANLMKPVEP